MSDLKKVTKEDLEKVAYKDLLSTFTELGIPEAWKPGTKGSAMIENALSLLDTIKSLENTDTKVIEEVLENSTPVEETLIDTTDVIKDLAVKIEEQKEVAQEEAVIQVQEEAIEKEKTEKEVLKDSIVAMNLSKEVVEKNIKNIKAALNLGIEAQRSILLTKKEILQDILDEDDFEKEVEE